jgi:plasmid stabilization system protein ParE
MITEIVHTETYKITLTLLVNNVEMAFGTSAAEKLLDRIDRIVEKITTNPYLYQAIPIDSRYRRAVISRQSSLVYEVTETKIILLYIFDNRQDPAWI